MTNERQKQLIQNAIGDLQEVQKNNEPLTRDDVKKILDQQLQLIAEESKKAINYRAKIECAMAILEITNSKFYWDSFRYTSNVKPGIAIDGNPFTISL